MKIKSKFPILMILVFGLLATIAYAKSFTDVLGESLGLIDDFFRNEGYKPYSLAIDLFVFFAVFLAIYMRGIKFAFKEITKTEKGLAIVLAFTTAFLLVIGDYSIVKLLPFLQYFLFFLLFALIWWLLKDMKSKWLRFLLALLLALLLLLIFFGLFSATSYRIGCPESALPWLPWLLALLLFILFWFLLKDIKNALGRFLLALLLTIAVVLLILFLLNTFSKNLGCPEGPFATSFFGDMSDSFKRMDIGTFGGFGGFGLGGSLLPELEKTSPPDQKKDEAGKTVAPEAQRPFKIYKDEELQQFLKDPRTQTPTIKQKLEEEIRIRNEEKKSQQQAPAGASPPAPKYGMPGASPAPTTSSPTPVPTSPPATKEPPKATPSSAKPPERKGLSIGLLGIVAVLALALGGGTIWLARRKGGRSSKDYPDMFGEGGFVGSPIDRIAQAIKKFDGIIALIESTQNEKDKFVMLGENREKLLEGLEKSSAANLWTDKGRKIIREENPILHELLALEEKLRGHLFELRTAENLFLKDLDSWQRIVPQDYHNYLKNLASKDAKPSEFKKMGIIQLASVCDAFEKQDEASIKELDALMKERNIAVLVRGKFKTVKADWDRLKKYNTHENVILSIIIGKIKEQKGALIKLEKEISKPGGNPEGSRNREDEKSQNSNPLERELAQKKAK